MDGVDRTAKDVAAYQNGTAGYRTDLYATKGTLMTHAEAIRLFEELGVMHMPELKAPAVKMPFESFTQARVRAEAHRRVQGGRRRPVARVAAIVPAGGRALLDRERAPSSGRQAVYLDDSYTARGWSAADESTWVRHDAVAPRPRRALHRAARLGAGQRSRADESSPRSTPGAPAEAGLEIIAWTVERSGPLRDGGGWYFQSISDVIDNDGDIFNLLDVLHNDVGVVGVFSDWPATTTFYANCAGAGADRKAAKE